MVEIIWFCDFIFLSVEEIPFSKNLKCLFSKTISEIILELTKSYSYFQERKKWQNLVISIK